LTGLDVAIAISLCICAVFGFWKGIVRAVVGIAGLLGGILLAGAYYNRVSAALWPDGGAWCPIAAYALILVAVLIAAALIATLLSRIIHLTALGLVDRIAGLVVGVFVAAMAWAALLNALLSLAPGMQDPVANSTLAPALLDLLTAVSSAHSTTT
jgi:membrane protein required for colicin V production